MEDGFDLEAVRRQVYTRDLELSCQKSSSEFRATVDIEDNRRLRLHILLLEDENDDLHEEVIRAGETEDDLRQEIQELVTANEAVEVELRSANAELRTKSRSLEQATAELDSLNGVSANSAKILSEKLALGNELASMKPELESLRSQVTSHQNTLSEKLSLQRQLSSVQVELETERRTVQRLQTREAKDDSRDSEARAELEEFRKELAREKREREKVEKETKKAASEWDSRKEVIEGKLDAMREKLRTTKQKLKDTQSELQEAQVVIETAAKVKQKANGSKAEAKNPRKRAAPETDAYANIGTPGANVAAAKRLKRSSTLPGEKSTFSMTPFLNRTSLAPESPTGRDAEAAATTEDRIQETVEPKSYDDAKHEADDDSPSARPAKSQKQSANQSQPAASKAAKPKPKTKSQAAPKVFGKPKLDIVAEESNDESEPVKTKEPAKRPPKAQAPSKTAKPAPSIIEEPEAKKKKRKILGGPGKTLFDEDEGDGARGGSKPLFGRNDFSFKPKMKTGLGTQSNAFGAFSPLKKDRKALAGR